jgi:phosphoglycerate dehydrogenase-like enzyme
MTHPTTRPAALLVMDEPTFQVQFRAEELDRLGRLVRLVAPGPLRELDSGPARARLAEADVLVTSWGVPALTDERLAAAPRLRAVLHAAGSVRELVSDGGVWRRGIVVSSAAGENAVAVAEYAFAAIVMAGKKAPFLATDTRHGHVSRYLRTRLSNRGRTIGVIGFSRTGRRLLELLRMLETAEILVSDPYADPAAVVAAGGRLVPLDELLSRAEILSLHAPALPGAPHLLGARELDMLPDGATLINTARGALVDHDALLAQCRSGRLDAVLDVTDPEPLPPDSPLLGLPNVMVTPHVAGSLGEETRRMSAHAIDELERWCAGKPLAASVSASSTAISA